MLARITAGHSLAVHTLPGTGGTQTVINAVGALVRDGKRVLVVSARRSTLEGVRHRLTGIGLPGLAVSPRDLQRDLIRAIGRNEKAEQPKVGDIDDALVRLRGVLRDYRAAVTARHPSLGVSVLDVLAPPRGAGEPHTGADGRGPVRPRRPRQRSRPPVRRRPRRSPRRLASASSASAPTTRPGTACRSPRRCRRASAHALAGKLHRQDVPNLLERGYELIAQTRMRPFQTIAELGVYLRLLQGIRDSLDRFSPTVFERPLGELIQAHGAAPRRAVADRLAAPPAAPALARVRATRRAHRRHARGARCASSSSAPSGSGSSTPA